jgi:uncharacterized protein (DUF433 family)
MVMLQHAAGTPCRRVRLTSNVGGASGTMALDKVKSRPEAAMDQSLVSRDPEIMSGTLCFAGTRVPVKNLFDYLEGSSSLEEFLEDFPSVSRARAIAVLEAARERLTADAPAA